MKNKFAKRGALIALLLCILILSAEFLILPFLYREKSFNPEAGVFTGYHFCSSNVLVKQQDSESTYIIQQGKPDFLCPFLKTNMRLLSQLIFSFPIPFSPYTMFLTIPINIIIYIFIGYWLGNLYWKVKNRKPN